MKALTTQPEMDFYQLVARRASLKLELVGMKRRGRTAYSICKQVYGLRGTRQRVLAQMNDLIELAHAKNRGEIQ